MTDHSATTVCAVIVSYHPEPAALLSLVDGLLPQVGAVVVVDNASEGDWQQPLDDKMSSAGGALLRQTHNIGLAAAQNLGIEWARSNGYRHVLLLDQDSEPGAGIVVSLLSALQTLSTTHKVAAVGPRFHDRREDRDAPFVRIHFPVNRKFWCGIDSQPIACDFLISSGALIPMDVLDRVGPMDAGLFIDNVDLEWGFRARAQGYALYGVCTATMDHRLGDSRRELPFGLGQVVVHGPVRLYYMMRNRLRLYAMPHTPWVWVAQDLPRVLVKLLLFGVLIGPRARNLRCMLRGLWDGLRGRQGACPSDLLPGSGSDSG
ncbi:glycosyltransferase family 2 protein [Rhodanobacter sp. MP7CTX1]|uniref:glycosyltransferase family 2 protein n=1 Tax=Rhodanobacter sp. MP7CTX1 TaxID=2723084 RepID=UPI0016211AC3|nr:glycosyltransferase family 2 protein [Rhodanobacter sp. MP7CTX1]MBB6187469.1 rhamnosyltransferase [Rhodanobacter sp. MP7CTX1]